MTDNNTAIQRTLTAIDSKTRSSSNNPTTATNTNTDNLRSKEHEQNDNWEWSNALVDFVSNHIEGLSLKICPGLKPIADVNVDTKNLGKVADSDKAGFRVTELPSNCERLERLQNAFQTTHDQSDIYGAISPRDKSSSDLYDGYACQGDMFDLPFQDNTFDTVISDPPWLELSQVERRRIFKEAVRVAKPTAKIIYNATWIPEDILTKQYDLRFRQQRDFWGGSSFLTFYRRTAEDLTELFEAYNYSSAERYPQDTSFWSETFPPQALSCDHNTDPRLPSTSPKHSQYQCPMCGCSELNQVRETGTYETSDGEYHLYECIDCQFRPTHEEVIAHANTHKSPNSPAIKSSTPKKQQTV